MQWIFVGLLAGAVQLAVLQTVIAVINFIYYAQLQVHTSETLLALEAALETFHENKEVFVQEGIHKHFNILKIHQMLHYAEAIRSLGTADGYNTEASERLHIDYAKEAYRASNKKDYVKQMTVWLGQQEAVSHFQAYLVYAAKQANTPSSETDQLEMDSDEELGNADLDLNDPTVPVSKSTTGITTHSVSIKPAYPHISLSTVITDFKAIGFLSALKSYIQCAYPPPALPLLPTTANHFDMYKWLNISQPPLATVGQEAFVDHIHATPALAVKGRGCLNDVPAHFDMALIRVEEERNNEATKGTYLEGMFETWTHFVFFRINSFILTLMLDRTPHWTGAAHFCPSRLLAW